MTWAQTFAIMGTILFAAGFVTPDERRSIAAFVWGASLIFSCIVYVFVGMVRP